MECSNYALEYLILSLFVRSVSPQKATRQELELVVLLAERLKADSIRSRYAEEISVREDEDRPLE